MPPSSKLRRSPPRRRLVAASLLGLLFVAACTDDEKSKDARGSGGATADGGSNGGAAGAGMGGEDASAGTAGMAGIGGGWRQLSPATSPPALGWPAMAYDEARDPHRLVRRSFEHHGGHVLRPDVGVGWDHLDAAHTGDHAPRSVGPRYGV